MLWFCTAVLVLSLCRKGRKLLHVTYLLFLHRSCELTPCHHYNTNYLSFLLGLVCCGGQTLFLEGSWLVCLILTPTPHPAPVGVGRWSVCKCPHHPLHPGNKDLAVLYGAACWTSLPEMGHSRDVRPGTHLTFWQAWHPSWSPPSQSQCSWAPGPELPAVGGSREPNISSVNTTG